MANVDTELTIWKLSETLNYPSASYWIYLFSTVLRRSIHFYKVTFIFTYQSTQAEILFLLLFLCFLCKKKQYGALSAEHYQWYTILSCDQLKRYMWNLIITLTEAEWLCVSLKIWNQWVQGWHCSILHICMFVCRPLEAFGACEADSFTNDSLSDIYVKALFLIFLLSHRHRSPPLICIVPAELSLISTPGILAFENTMWQTSYIWTNLYGCIVFMSSDVVESKTQCGDELLSLGCMGNDNFL